jgi:hypothetical protein
MLAYSPPFPLIIDYGDEDREVTAQDEGGILFALRRCRRVRYIRLSMPSSSLRRLLAILDGEFSMLENLYIKPLTNGDHGLSIPKTFNAPHLRHFSLRNITYPPGILRPPPPIPDISLIERTSQSTLYYGPQLWRCAPFSSSIYWLVDERSPRITDH